MWDLECHSISLSPKKHNKYLIKVRSLLHTTFHIMSIGWTTIILGHTWLMEHNPKIDWCTREVTMTYCPSSCRTRTTPEQPDWPILGNILPKPSPAKGCTLRKSWKISQDLPSLDHPQASHGQTWTRWAKVTDSLYTSWATDCKKLGPLKQCLRDWLKQQGRPTQHISRT